LGGRLTMSEPLRADEVRDLYRQTHMPFAVQVSPYAQPP